MNNANLSNDKGEKIDLNQEGNRLTVFWLLDDISGDDMKKYEISNLEDVKKSVSDFKKYLNSEHILSSSDSFKLSFYQVKPLFEYVWNTLKLKKWDFKFREEALSAYVWPWKSEELILNSKVHAASELHDNIIEDNKKPWSIKRNPIKTIQNRVAKILEITEKGKDEKLQKEKKIISFDNYGTYDYDIKRINLSELDDKSLTMLLSQHIENNWLYREYFAWEWERSVVKRDLTMSHFPWERFNSQVSKDKDISNGNYIMFDWTWRQNWMDVKVWVRVKVPYDRNKFDLWKMWMAGRTISNTILENDIIKATNNKEPI